MFLLPHHHQLPPDNLRQWIQHSPPRVTFSLLLIYFSTWSCIEGCQPGKYFATAMVTYREGISLEFLRATKTAGGIFHVPTSNAARVGGSPTPPRQREYSPMELSATSQPGFYRSCKFIGNTHMYAATSGSTSRRRALINTEVRRQSTISTGEYPTKRSFAAPHSARRVWFIPASS